MKNAPKERVDDDSVSADTDRFYACAECGAPRPLAGYRAMYGGRFRALACLDCEAARVVAYHAAKYRVNFDHIRVQKQGYQRRNAAAIAAYQAEWRAAHQEEITAYRHAYNETYREEIRRKSRAAYWEDVEVSRAINRLRYAADPAKFKRWSAATASRVSAGALARRQARAAETRRQRRERDRSFVDRLVVRYYGDDALTPESLHAPGRREPVATARAIVCYILGTTLHHPTVEIAAHFDLDHSTVHHHITTLRAQVRRGTPATRAGDARVLRAAVLEELPARRRRARDKCQVKRARRSDMTRRRLALVPPPPPPRVIVNPERARYERIMERRQRDERELREITG